MKKILLILLSIFFLSCGVKNSNDNEHIFYLDNPSNEDIEIILDSQTYRLKARTFEILKLKTGEHIAELSDKRKVYFKIFENSKGGIINPTGATYTINFIRYQSSGICVDWSESENTVLPTFDDFIIDKNYIDWEYDIFEEATKESMPKKLSPNEDIHVFTKIYSPSEKDVDYDIERPKANLPKIDGNYNIPENKDKTFQNYIKQIIELDKAYQDTNDIKKQKKILKEYDKIAKILWSEYPKYNIVQGSYDNVDLKALNLKSLDRGVIITKIEE